MKHFMGRLGLVLAVLAVAGGIVWFTPALRVPVDVWSINSRVVPLDYADWDYLSVRSGERGRKALAELARHGTSDDIRITADYMLNDYTPPERMCGDAPCANIMPAPKFHPVATALEIVTDLRPGQVLPHEFVIETANNHYLIRCRGYNRDCVLRMQDFDGDGKDEVYAETVARDAPGMPEAEDRGLTIYCQDKDRWAICNVVILRNYDARTWPQRPFVVETTTMDDLLINGTTFHFAEPPDYSHYSRDYSREPVGPDPAIAAKEMVAIGGFADRIPVIFPAGGHLPPDLTPSLRAGRVHVIPTGDNPPLPTPLAEKGTLVFYTLPAGCGDAQTCSAIVADLDHDGQDEVILAHDPDPSDSSAPIRAALLKKDGTGWRVAANVDLCKKFVPDISKAKIEILPAKQHVIRLGQNRYPLEWNPSCSVGYIL